MLDFIGVFSQQTVDPFAIVEYSIWGAGVPGNPQTNDSSSTVLGTKFYTSEPGWIRGIRWYRDAGSAGASVVALWQGTTNLSGDVAVTGQTASGWQRQDFATPISIAAGTTYLTSALYPTGIYQAQGGYFSASSFTNGPITCPAGTVDANGLYIYSASMALPNSQYNYASYFIDIIFAA